MFRKIQMLTLPLTLLTCNNLSLCFNCNNKKHTIGERRSIRNASKTGNKGNFILRYLLERFSYIFNITTTIIIEEFAIRDVPWLW
jgi:hypothetical protein